MTITNRSWYAELNAWYLCRIHAQSCMFHTMLPYLSYFYLELSNLCLLFFLVSIRSLPTDRYNVEPDFEEQLHISRISRPDHRPALSIPTPLCGSQESSGILAV